MNGSKCSPISSNPNFVYEEKSSVKSNAFGSDEIYRVLMVDLPRAVFRLSTKPLATLTL